MPSPFPGMDPYLEGPKWMSVHSALTVEIAPQLSHHLPPRYAALPNERMVVTTAENDDVSITRGSILPDRSIVDLGDARGGPGRAERVEHNGCDARPHGRDAHARIHPSRDCRDPG